MECIPAIDLLGGRAVRLVKGDFTASTDYGDPLELAARYVAAGAARVHVVDLDAARSGAPVNRGTVLALAQNCRAAGVGVQVGGGVRDEARATDLLEAGVQRVVLGTVAMEDPELAIRLAQTFPGRIVVGLDHRRVANGREVAVHGWTSGAGRHLEDAVALFSRCPLAALIVTDIGRDGTLEGPDLEGYRELLAGTATPLVASGGVGSLEDLSALAALEVAGRRLGGVIVGKALVSGAFTLEEAVVACAP